MRTYFLLTALLWAGLTAKADPPKIENQGDATIITSGDKQVKIEPGADSNPDAQITGFDGSFDMNMNTTMKNGKSTSSSMSLYIRGFETAIEMSEPGGKSAAPMRMILNSQTNDIITLVSDGGKKTGMKMKMPKITVSGVTDDNSTDCVVKKTDETKVIEGYTCRKYIMTYNDGAVMEAWISQDLKLNLGSLMTMVNGSMKGKGPDGGGKYPNMQGMTLETNYTGTDGSRSQMLIKNLKVGNPDASKFSTEGYQIIDLSGMSMPMFGQ